MAKQRPQTGWRGTAINEPPSQASAAAPGGSQSIQHGGGPGNGNKWQR